MPDQMVGGKTPPKGKAAPRPKIGSDSPAARAARAKAAAAAAKAKSAAAQKANAAAKASEAKIAAATSKVPGSTTAPSTTPTNPNLLPGATDPFAGTPYAGKSPYEIAQQIVQEEIDNQTKEINAQRDAQIQANQNALSVLSQLGLQLQQGAGQFATNYNQSLQNMPGAGGAPDGGKSFQGFNAGYNAAQSIIQSGMGASGSQAGGPSQAAPLSSSVMGGDAQNTINSAIQQNPFAVLPAAYGRQAQMDANLLAANQASSLSSYSQAVLDLYSSANKDIFDEFNTIKSEFDAANGAVTSAQADQAAARAKAQADAQKTYQWQYHEAAARAAELTRTTGLLYQPDPNTLKPVLVRDKQGRPVTTIQGQQAGVRNAATEASTQARLKALAISDANLKERIAHDQAIESNAKASLQLRQQAAARLATYRKQLQANAQQRIAISKANAGKGGKAASTAQTKAAGAVSSAAGYAQKLSQATVKTGATINPDGSVTPAGTKPKFSKQRIYQMVYAKYARILFAYYKQIYPGQKLQPYVDKAIHQAVYG